jgi:hypothetical protein
MAEYFDPKRLLGGAVLHGRCGMIVTCIKCKNDGSLVAKTTKSKGHSYRYYYIEHHVGEKIKWCYLGKYENLPEDYKKLVKPPSP